MSSILFKKARVLAMDATSSDLPAADVLVEGSRIEAIEADLTAGAETARPCTPIPAVARTKGDAW